jgi:hypothetical protein
MHNFVLGGITFLLLGAVSALLLLGHPGMAIQFSSYLFCWLVAVFVYEKVCA